MMTNNYARTSYHQTLVHMCSSVQTITNSIIDNSSHRHRLREPSTPTTSSDQHTNNIILCPMLIRIINPLFLIHFKQFSA